MAKFEAHPNTDIIHHMKENPKTYPEWLVLERDEEGNFGDKYDAITIFRGLGAEMFAKAHAELLEAIHLNNSPETPAEPQSTLCEHCGADPSAHAPNCLMKTREMLCPHCNLNYLGNLLEPCERCGTSPETDDPEIDGVSGNEDRKPETGNEVPLEGTGKRWVCPDCGVEDGELHEAGCPMLTPLDSDVWGSIVEESSVPDEEGTAEYTED